MSSHRGDVRGGSLVGWASERNLICYGASINAALQPERSLPKEATLSLLIRTSARLLVRIRNVISHLCKSTEGLSKVCVCLGVSIKTS